MTTTPFFCATDKYNTITVEYINMTQVRVIGKNIQLNIAEKEWLKAMQGLYRITEAEALDEIIMYKREQAFMHRQQGNLELARHLLQEIDEWDDTKEAEFQEAKERLDELNHKIILPGE